MAVDCFIYLSPRLQEIWTLKWLAEMDIFTLQSLEITDLEKRKGRGGLFEVVWFTSLLHNLSFFQFFSLSYTHIIWRTLTHTRIGQTHNRSHNRGWGDEEVEDDDRLLLAIISSEQQKPTQDWHSVLFLLGFFVAYEPRSKHYCCHFVVASPCHCASVCD